MARLFSIHLQYSARHTADGLPYLDELERRLSPEAPVTRIIVDNALTPGVTVLHEGVFLHGGDNSAHEFSGWDAGLRMLEPREKPDDEDVILFSNDTFFRNYDPALQSHFSPGHVLAASKRDCLAGIVDEFPEPMPICGKVRTAWVRSNCFLINYGLLKKIGSLTCPVPPSVFFEDVWPEFFRSGSGLDEKYKAFLRIWLFREESDLLAYRYHWYKSEPLTSDNFALMRSKAYSIICEHDLSGRVLDLGGKLLDIAVRKKTFTYPRKKILFITEHNPFGHSYGGQQRTNLIFRALQEIGHVHLFCVNNEPRPELMLTDTYTVEFFGTVPYHWIPKRFLRMLLDMFDPYAIHPLNPGYREAIGKLLEKTDFDIIFVRYLDPVFRCGLYGIKGLVVDVDDLPSQYYFTMARSPGLTWKARAYHIYSALSTWWHGKRVIRNARRALYSNPLQAKGMNAVFLPNIPFDASEKATPEPLPEAVENRVLFVGNLNYLPNSQGIDHFIRFIWPAVKDKVGDAVLEIAGFMNDPDLKKRWEAVPGVEVLGFVPDLTACYAGSKVAIVHVREGAGTHIKILEAMQYRKACVVNSFAARGFSDLLVHEQNVMIASRDADFAEAVIRLLTDDALNRRIGEAAGKAMAVRYNREAFNRILKEALI